MVKTPPANTQKPSAQTSQVDLQALIAAELARGYQLVKSDQPGFVKLVRPAGHWHKIAGYLEPAQTTYIRAPQ